MFRLTFLRSNDVSIFMCESYYLTVINGVMNGPVAFQSNSHRHEDGSRDSDTDKRVQKVGKHPSMHIRGQKEPFPKAVHDGGD